MHCIIPVQNPSSVSSRPCCIISTGVTFFDFGGTLYASLPTFPNTSWATSPSTGLAHVDAWGLLQCTHTHEYTKCGGKDTVCAGAILGSVHDQYTWISRPVFGTTSVYCTYLHLRTQACSESTSSHPERPCTRAGIHTCRDAHTRACAYTVRLSYSIPPLQHITLNLYITMVASDQSSWA